MAALGECIRTVPGVKCKSGATKGKGVLKVYTTTLKWAGRDAEATVLLRAVGRQLVSKADAATAVLMLKMKDEAKEDVKFTFAAKAVRDEVKDLVANLLQNPVNSGVATAAAGLAGAAGAAEADDDVIVVGDEDNGIRKSVDPNLKQKVAVLRDNAITKSLFQSVTQAGVLSKDDFFKGYEMDDAGGGERGPQTSGQKDQIGISSNLLAQFKPQEQATSTEINYRITEDMQSQIFAMYPALKQWYDEKVPHHISKKHFWHQALQSELFHRGTGVAPLDTSIGAGSDITELFSRVRQQSGVSSSGASSGPSGKRRRVEADADVDPRCNLDASEDRDVDGYGTDRQRSNEVAESEMHQKGGARIRKRRRNVIDLPQINIDSNSILTMMKTAAPVPKPASAAADPYDAMRNGQELVDLRAEPKPNVKPLRFTLASIAAKCAGTSDHDKDTQSKNVNHEIVSVTKDPGTLDVADICAAGVSALEYLEREHLSVRSEEVVPPNISAMIQQYDEAITGVLKHFWVCFPPGAPWPKLKDAAGAKAQRMRAVLQDECIAIHIKNLRSKIEREQPGLIHLVNDLEGRVFRAIEHHDDWKTALRARLAAAKARLKKSQTIQPAS